MLRCACVLIILFSTLVPLTVRADATANHKTSEPSPAARFLQAWQEYDHNDPLSAFGLAYTVLTEGWSGERSARREIIRFGEASRNKGHGSQGIQMVLPFQLLEALQNERLRDATADSNEIFSFTLLRALDVTERHRTVTLDAHAQCQMDAGVPLRFIFEFNPPKGLAIESFQKLQIIFTWSDRSFNETLHRVPSEILVEALVQRAG